MARRDTAHAVDHAHVAYQVAADPYAEQAVEGNDYRWGVEDSGLALFDGSTDIRVHVSAAATAGAGLSLVGLCTVLTGLLAAEGLVLAAVGLMVSLTGLVTANRPARTGSGLAGLGILCSLAAIILAVAALSGQLSWPNSNSDEIARMHAWLVGHGSWLHHRFHVS